MTYFIYLKPWVSLHSSYFGGLLLSGVRWQDDIMSGLELRAKPYSSSKLQSAWLPTLLHIFISLE